MASTEAATGVQRIADAFAKNDMELAFPQMDLWFRNRLDVDSQIRKAAIESDQTQPKADATSDSKRD